MNKVSPFGRRHTCSNCPVHLIDFPISDHFIQPGECFAGAGEDQGSTHRPIQPMDNAQVNITGLIVFLFYVLFNGFTQWNIPGFITLHNVGRTFVYNNYVVILIKDLGGWYLADLLDRNRIMKSDIRNQKSELF
jgi:hypothetical protein